MIALKVIAAAVGAAFLYLMHSTDVGADVVLAIVSLVS